MTLLREIQAAATETDVPLPTVLRKCKVLASRLRHEPLKEWTDWELNGYPNEDVLPNYRSRFGVTVLGHFSGPFGSGLRNARLPQFSVDEEHRDWLFHVSFLEPVAVLEDMATRAEGGLRYPWPADLVAYYQERFYEDMVLMTADRVVASAVVRGILDTVRTRILTFALEIEEAAPDAGEGDRGDVSSERVSQIFNTYIYGGQGSVVAAGGDAIHVNVQLPSSWQALRRELAALGVADEDLVELEAAVRADAARGEEVGEATQGWLGRMTTRIARGATEVGTGTTAEVIGGTILRYLAGG
jgi:hypothetical protein